MEKTIFIIIVVILIIGVVGALIYQEISKNRDIDTNTLSVSLGEEFTLHEKQSAKIENEGLELKITEFYNSPCPERVECIWSGIGIGFEYSYNGEIERGINLVKVFGYKTTIIKTDYETYAILKIEKIG